MKSKTINNEISLEKYCSKIGGKISKVFTGRDRGEEVRDKSKIDELFEKYHTISVIIPQGTFSITPSFLEEFFVNIVTKYGVENFRKNVHIETNGYILDSQLEEAINRILQRKTGIDR